MTAHQVVEHCGRNVYQIWLELAMKHFNEADPSASFVLAENFVKELLCQEPKFK